MEARFGHFGAPPLICSRAFWCAPLTRSLALAQASLADSKKSSKGENKAHPATPGFKVTADLVDASRRAGYDNVVTENGGAEGAVHTMLWLSILSFFGSPPGVFCVYGILHFCSGLQTPQNIVVNPIKTFVQSTLITGCGSVVTFIPFARTWDALYEKYPELRCQQDKAHDVGGLNRLEVKLAVMNLFGAAALSSLVAVVHLMYPGVDKI